MKPTEDSSGTLRRSEEPEVSAEHQNRVECAEAVIETLERHGVRAFQAAQATRLDRRRGIVDANDLETTIAEMQHEPPCSASDVEDMPPHVAHHLTFDRPPLLDAGE